MTRDETILLWKACQDARAAALAAGRSDLDAHDAAKMTWNAWAERVLEERSALEQSGQWQSETLIAMGRGREWQTGANRATQAWFEAAFIAFTGHTFETEADFSGFIFPGDTDFGWQRIFKGKEIEAAAFNAHASFSDVVFKGLCRFTRVIFRKRTWFDQARFEKSVHFARSEFCESASFRRTEFVSEVYCAGAKFADDAWFNEARFRGETRFYGATFNFTIFEQATFERRASFDHAVFHKFAGFKQAIFLNEPASFDGAVIDGGVSFYGTYFEKLPDLSQAVFSGAPRLDYVKFGDKLQRDRFWGSIFGSKAGLEHEAAKYRALRALAIAAHDYENEAQAFKGEVRSRRGIDHKPWHGVYWVGLFYDALSGFGRSIMRPLWAWLLSVPAFAVAYLLNAGRLLDAAASCPDGSSAAWMKALMFALKNAVLFVNWDREQIRAAYICLFPQTAGQELVVPTTNALIQAAQSVWSAVIIFLFLLAVKNQFKIR